MSSIKWHIYPGSPTIWRNIQRNIKTEKNYYKHIDQEHEQDLKSKRTPWHQWLILLWPTNMSVLVSDHKKNCNWEPAELRHPHPTPPFDSAMQCSRIWSPDLVIWVSFFLSKVLSICLHSNHFFKFEEQNCLINARQIEKYKKRQLKSNKWSNEL